MEKNKTFTISVFEVIGGDSAISADDGQHLYERIKKAMAQMDHISVDFKNIDLVVSSFLNAAFGQLVGDYSLEEVKKRVSVKNLSDDDCDLLSTVLDMAVQYFADRERFSLAVSKGFEDDH